MVSSLKYKRYGRIGDKELQGKSASIHPEEERGKRNQIKEFKFVSALSPKVCHDSGFTPLERPNGIIL